MTSTFLINPGPVHAFGHHVGHFVWLHPIWYLVDADVHDDSLINRVLLSLPPDIHSKLFNSDNNGVMRRKEFHIESKRKLIYRPLYIRISEIFNQSPVDYDRLNAIFIEDHLPLQVVPDDWINIEDLAEAYSDVLNSATKIGLVADSNKEKFLFIHSIDHTDFSKVRNDFKALESAQIKSLDLNKHTLGTIRRFQDILKKS